MSTDQKSIMLQMAYSLDAEIAEVDLAIGHAIAKRRREALPRPRRPKKARSFWVKSWFLLRDTHGQYALLMKELRLKDQQSFRNFTRMTPHLFFALLERLTPRIEKEDTNWRKALAPGLRLALTLRFYASGDSYKSLSYNWYIGGSSCSNMIREVSEAIIAEFSEELLTPPLNPKKWKAVANTFATRWNFEHTLGALDGKHIRIKKPNGSGSKYYNYKGFCSIIMMALVDGDYNFQWIDVGTPGSASDAQIWNSIDLLEYIEANKMGIPAPEPLPQGDRPIPYFIVADDAFALKSYLMKPYSKRNLTKPEKIFNYRLSRARRIVENAFGILANRFRCFMTQMQQTPKTVTSIVIACCCLHNILRKENPILRKGTVDQEDDQHNVIDGEWRERTLLVDGEVERYRNQGTNQVKAMRDYLASYYNSPKGAVEWQERMIDH